MKKYFSIISCIFAVLLLGASTVNARMASPSFHGDVKLAPQHKLRSAEALTARICSVKELKVFDAANTFKVTYLCYSNNQVVEGHQIMDNNGDGQPDLVDGNLFGSLSSAEQQSASAMFNKGSALLNIMFQHVNTAKTENILGTKSECHRFEIVTPDEKTYKYRIVSVFSYPGGLPDRRFVVEQESDGKRVEMDISSKSSYHDVVFGGVLPTITANGCNVSDALKVN